MHWLEELLQTYGQLKVAAEASHLDDNRKVLAMDRAVVKAHHRRHLDPKLEPPPEDSEEDMIHIGDRHEHHPTVTPTPNGPWLKWLTILAVLTGGAGGGLGGAWLLKGFSQPAATPRPLPPAAPQTAPDQDTLFELRLGPPNREPGT